MSPNEHGAGCGGNSKVGGYDFAQQSVLAAAEDMLWILRRTRLSGAALLNTLNNNNGNESRPARKDYNKLSGEEQTARNRTSEHLDNAPSCKDNNTCAGNTALDSDTDSSFTDLEMDDRDDFSDDSDYEEALTCNVCDRSFACPKQLSSHKQKKRHFGCSACDSLFPSLMALEHHKEEFEHWSDDDDILTDSDDDDDDTVISEECERLL